MILHQIIRKTLWIVFVLVVSVAYPGIIHSQPTGEQPIYNGSTLLNLGWSNDGQLLTFLENYAERATFSEDGWYVYDLTTG